MAALTLLQAQKNAVKLTNNEKEGEKTIEEGKAIMQRINKRREQKI